MVCIISSDDALNIVPWRFQNSVSFILNHFSDDPAITPINAIGHQLKTLCRSICEEEKSRNVQPKMTSEYFPLTSAYILVLTLMVKFVLRRIRRRFEPFVAGGSKTVTRCSSHKRTSDTSDDQTEVRPPRLRVLARRNFERRKVGGGRGRPLFRDWAHRCYSKTRFFYWRKHVCSRNDRRLHYTIFEGD